MQCGLMGASLIICWNLSQGIFWVEFLIVGFILLVLSLFIFFLFFYVYQLLKNKQVFTELHFGVHLAFFYIVLILWQLEFISIFYYTSFLFYFLYGFIVLITLNFNWENNACNEIQNSIKTE